MEIIKNYAIMMTLIVYSVILVIKVNVQCIELITLLMLMGLVLSYVLIRTLTVLLVMLMISPYVLNVIIIFSWTSIIGV